MKVTQIEIDGTNYVVNIERKRVKNLNFKFKNGMFYISCPYFYFTKDILKHLETIGSKLIKRVNSSKKVMICSDFYYLYGEKYFGNVVKEGNLEIHYHSNKEFYNIIKNDYLSYLTERVNYYKKLMGLNYNYQISVRYMKTRYGSNTIKQYKLHFNYILVHFKKEIIDSVIVHELAHSFEANHGPNFYKIIYKYCPNYDKLTKELKSVHYVEDY